MTPKLHWYYAMNKKIQTDADLLEQCPPELFDLYVAIKDFPSANKSMLQELLHKHLEATVRRRRIMTMVLETMSQLRLDIKYLLFDLDATRKERDEYLIRLRNAESDS